MKPSPSKDGKPVLDEATFQKLLEAAYVVQEHTDPNRPSALIEARPEASPVVSDSATALAEIVDTQHQIHTGHLDLDGSSSLIAERIRKVTGAEGAAIGILESDTLIYRAGSGILAHQAGVALRPEATLSASTLLHDAILRCPDAGTDFRVNPEIAKRLGIRSLISVPVFHDGKTAGSLELVFASANAFHEQDVRTCQLMAGLITEALTHAAEEEWRKGVTAERASMLEVLEKIKPQLARLAQEPSPAKPFEAAPAEVEESSSEESKCQHCGHQLAPEEVFCGSCGTSRSASARNDLQGKWATLWNLTKASGQAQPNLVDEHDRGNADLQKTGQAEPSIPPAEDFALPDFILPERKVPTSPPPQPPSEPAEIHEPVMTTPPPEESLVERNAPLVQAPASIVKAPESRVWLRSIAVSPPAVQLKGFWQKSKSFVRKHPGDLALAAAAVLFVITIVWAISANNPTTSADSGAQSPANAPVAAKPKRKSPPAPKLGMFDQLLVSLGLAEPPPAPTYSGNPDIPVWVDVHTALYYCPGTELYGKTPQGKIASQRDAQMDQFEPAFRKVCE
jgi:hypothetical protein